MTTISIFNGKERDKRYAILLWHDVETGRDTIARLDETDAATLRDRLMALAAAAPPEHPKPPPSPARKPAKAPVAEAVNEAMLQDLIAAMGPDLVKRQLSLVLDQVRALCRDAAGLSAGDLMAQAHKMGGAANVMGATGLGAALYRCEDAAAAASPAAITAAITALDGQADALAAVLDRL